MFFNLRSPSALCALPALPFLIRHLLTCEILQTRFQHFLSRISTQEISKLQVHCRSRFQLWQGGNRTLLFPLCKQLPVETAHFISYLYVPFVQHVKNLSGFFRLTLKLTYIILQSWLNPSASNSCRTQNY